MPIWRCTAQNRTDATPAVFSRPRLSRAFRSGASFSAWAAPRLLRWHPPSRGLVAPSEFIAVAEEIGVIVPLGAWVIQQACRDAATWLKHIGVAVNLSSLQFKGLTLIQTVVSALDAAGLSPLRLELEIASGQIANSASPTSKLPYCRSDPVLALLRVSVALFSMPVSSGPLGGLGTAAK